jgi:hypothetical protein
VSIGNLDLADIGLILAALGVVVVLVLETFRGRSRNRDNHDDDE